MHLEQDEDSEAMRLAFEKFMIGGGGIGTIQLSKKSKEEDMADRKMKQESSRRNRIHIEMKRAEKRYWHTFRSFFDMIQNEWLDTDNQLEQVVNSMASIRNRIPMESSLLDRFNDVVKRKEWACYGNNQSLVGGNPEWGKSNELFINVEDAQLAITHDLLEHERMMGCLRNLFSDLSTYHEDLSRTLDGIIKHHLKINEELMMYEETGCEPLPVSSKLESAMDIIDSLIDTFKDLSMELYRKQILVGLVFDSAKDGLFQKDTPMKNGHSNDAESDWENLGSYETMLKISHQWPRTSKSCHMNIPQLERLLKLCTSKIGPD